MGIPNAPLENGALDGGLKGHGRWEKRRDMGKIERYGPVPGAMAWEDKCGIGMAMPWGREQGALRYLPGQKIIFYDGKQSP
jgi:hypothetical protein